jgi:hypothetical protein
MSQQNVLPLSNVINVTVTPTPSGLSTPNVNSLAIFTTEAPTNNFAAYGVYLNPQQVITDYGTNSVTAAMANDVFAQTPNILSGGGQLVIIPLQAAVSATSGNFNTADISANLASFIAVTHGQFKVTINGTAYNIGGTGAGTISFANCATFADIAAVLQPLIEDAIVTSTATGLVITSKKVGTASTVTVGSVIGGTGTDLSAAGYINQAGGTSNAGAAATGETIAQAITRLTGQVFYAAAMTNLLFDDTVAAALATTVQALDLIFVHHFSSIQDIAGIISTVTLASDNKFRAILYTISQAAANLCKAAYSGRNFSVDFTGSKTSQTMNLKSLANITPDTGISQTNLNAALAAGADVYVNISGVPVVLTSGANEFTDMPYSDLALKFALQTAGFNYLRTTETKVPQTEAGMNGLKDAYIQVMDQFVENGCLAPGTWTSASTFGDPQIFKNNILNNGYYVYSQPIGLQNSSDRANRKAPLCQIAAKRAGAIDTSNVLVLVNA